MVVISLKPGSKMDEMRYDMCGGAAVVGLFHAIKNGALRGVRGKTRVVGVIAASENMPDASAQKPGDVVRACDGTTIEILNTDAEGRLILADALAYACKTFKPAKSRRSRDAHWCGDHGARARSHGYHGERR